MRKYQIHTFATIALFMTTALLVSCSGKDESHKREFTKQERNLIKDGIKAYQDSDYQAADVAFEKAAAQYPDNEFAAYNSALTRMQSSSITDRAQVDSVLSSVDSVFHYITAYNQNDTIVREYATYNRGNIAYNKQDYQSSIDLYKQILRADTANREALENLRLAQLKLQQQQDQQGGGDNDQDQDQDQQQQQNQQQQNQQNQDQQQQQDKQQQDQQQQQQDQQKKDQQKKADDQQQKPQDKKNGGMSQNSAKQILDAMEKKEAATRQKFDVMKQDKEKREANNVTTNKPW